MGFKMNKEEYAEFVKNSRIDMNMTKSSFAHALDITWMTLWRWENKRSMPAANIVDMWVNKIKVLSHENT